MARGTCEEGSAITAQCPGEGAKVMSNCLLFFSLLLTKPSSDIEIAVAQTPKPITHLASEIGILPDELESYGRYKAKVELSILKRLAHRKDGKYIVISG